MKHSRSQSQTLTILTLGIEDLGQVNGGEDEYGGGADYGAANDYSGGGGGYAGANEMESANDAYSGGGGGYAGTNEMESANDAYDGGGGYAGANEMESANEAYDGGGGYAGANEMESANDAYDGGGGYSGQNEMESLNEANDSGGGYSGMNEMESLNEANSGGGYSGQNEMESLNEANSGGYSGQNEMESLSEANSGGGYSGQNEMESLNEANSEGGTGGSTTKDAVITGMKGLEQAHAGGQEVLENKSAIQSVARYAEDANVPGARTAAKWADNIPVGAGAKVGAKMLGVAGTGIGMGIDVMEHGKPQSGRDWAAFTVKHSVEAVPIGGAVAGITGFSDKLAGAATGSTRYGNPEPPPTGSVAPYDAP